MAEPRLSSSNRNLPAFRKDSKKNPKGFPTSRVPRGTRVGSGTGKGVLSFRYPALPASESSQESEDAWKAVKVQLLEAVPLGLCRVWFGPITCVGISGSKLALLAPGSVVYGVKRAYQGTIEAAIREATDLDGFVISDREAA